MPALPGNATSLAGHGTSGAALQGRSRSRIAGPASFFQALDQRYWSAAEANLARTGFCSR